MPDKFIEEAMQEAVGYCGSMPVYAQPDLLSALEKIKQELDNEWWEVDDSVYRDKLAGKIDLLDQLINSLK